MTASQDLRSVKEYDSRPETLLHIQNVQRRLNACVRDLLLRGELHDQSKLGTPEVEAFDEATPKLAAMEYGTDEYKASLDALGPALAHHYEMNRHHPEHFAGGIRDMNLLDLLEMLCDWKAASERMKGGTRDSHAVARERAGGHGVRIDFNQERYGFSDELKAILENTLRDLGW